jgi:hypothetical protein
MENLLNGFGQSSLAELEELNKALGTGETGEAYGDGSYSSMTAIRPQSLEGTLKVVTAQEQHIKFWKAISKKQAFNTVEEFNVLDSLGSNSSPFFTEGGLPNEEDSNYIRQSQMVKFLGTTRVITHPATLVRNTVGDMIARETTNGTLWYNSIVDEVDIMIHNGTTWVGYKDPSNPLVVDLGAGIKPTDVNGPIVAATEPTTQSDGETALANGDLWINIGDIDGAGTSTLSNSYILIDNSYKNVINYYRLKQTDFDGEFKYSYIISINNSTDRKTFRTTNPIT